MGLFLVFYILLLGYLYSEKNRVAQAKLSRSSGWISYVLLGKYGARCLFFGFCSTVLFWFLLFVVSKIINLFPINVDLSYWLNNRSISVFEHNIYYGFILFFLLSFIFSQSDEESDEGLENVDDISNVIIESIEKDMLVKIALLSGKVYVAKIDSEDLKYNSGAITFIPFLSGYRDEKTKEVHFNCNYASIYETNKLTPEELRVFRTVVMLDQIESFSLFDTQYYNSFKKDSEFKENVKEQL